MAARQGRSRSEAGLLAAWHDRRDAESCRILCDRHQGLVQMLAPVSSMCAMLYPGAHLAAPPGLRTK